MLPSEHTDCKMLNWFWEKTNMCCEETTFYAREQKSREWTQVEQKKKKNFKTYIFSFHPCLFLLSYRHCINNKNCNCKIIKIERTQMTQWLILKSLLRLRSKADNRWNYSCVWCETFKFSITFYFLYTRTKKTQLQAVTFLWLSMVIKINHLRSVIITILAHSFSSWNSLTNNSSFRVIEVMNRQAIDWSRSQVEWLDLSAGGVWIPLRENLENWL